MYIYFFERVVRAASGDDDFALPYWNYGLPGQAALPPPFRQRDIQGVPNILHDGSRLASVNAGSPLLASSVTAANALGKLAFGGPNGFSGEVENTPHGVVHTGIGGNMSEFETAGRDPIFWLHHANVDRLWELWLSQGSGRGNPTNDTTWMTREFTFVDENKAFVALSGAEILMTVGQLRYQYDDPRECIPLRFIEDDRFFQVAQKMRRLNSFSIASGIELRADQARLDLEFSAAGTSERAAKALSPESMLADLERGTRWVVTFEGLSTQEPMPGHFEVYLGLPDGERPDFTSPYYLGNLSTFGADERSRHSMSARTHGNHMAGIDQQLDITEALNRLVQRGIVGKGEFKLTLVSVGVPDALDGTFRLGEQVNPRIANVLLESFRDAE